jgi:hypothetical protein
VKYSDNLYKGFGSSIAIVIASLFNGVMFHDVSLNERFALGSFLVIVSSIAYYTLTAAPISHAHSHHHVVAEREKSLNSVATNDRKTEKLIDTKRDSLQHAIGHSAYIVVLNDDSSSSMATTLDTVSEADDTTVVKDVETAS